MDDLDLRLQRLVRAPYGPLDLDVVIARGRRRRRRRWARDAALLAGLLVASATGWGQLFGTPATTPTIIGEPGPSPTVEQVEGPAPTDDATTAPSTRGGPEATQAMGASDVGEGPAPGSSTDAEGAVAAPMTPPPDAGPTADDPDPDGCEVVTGTCSFVARGPGGFRGEDGDWSITVERDGISTVYTAVDGQCRDDVIQAGDHVVVDAAVGEGVGGIDGGVFAGYRPVGAGAEYGCD